MNQSRRRLRQLVSRLAALPAEAGSLGIFVADRELLECPGCGLQEDVDCGGQLLTCLPSSSGRDTGLRFEEFRGDRFRCPACGAMIEGLCPARYDQQG